MNDVSATGLGTPGSDWFIFAHWIGNDKALHNLCSGELVLIMPLSFSILIYTYMLKNHFEKHFIYLTQVED